MECYQITMLCGTLPNHYVAWNIIKSTCHIVHAMHKEYYYYITMPHGLLPNYNATWNVIVPCYVLPIIIIVSMLLFLMLL